MYKIFKRKKSNQKGFTLIELIIVIAIIAILAAIAIPAIGGYIKSANEGSADANARTVYGAAASAAASYLAAGGSFGSSPTIVANTAGATNTWTATGGTTATTFSSIIAENLGTNFKAVASVTIATTGAVTQAIATTSGISGVYPKP